MSLAACVDVLKHAAYLLVLLSGLCLCFRVETKVMIALLPISSCLDDQVLFLMSVSLHCVIAIHPLKSAHTQFADPPDA